MAPAAPKKRGDTRAKKRPILAGALFLGMGAFALFACVDLFHSTDFATLCTANPAACQAESGPDAPLSDAMVVDSETSAPPIDFCLWTAAEARTRAEHTCAWLSACEGALDESTFGGCMLQALAAFDCAYNPTLRPNGEAKALWSCLANAETCDATQACIYGSTQPPPCPQIEAGAFTRCTQPPRTNAQCGPGEDKHPPNAIQSCTLEGRGCVDVDLSTAVCTGKAGILCTGAPRCDGTNAVQCRNTTDVGLDCASFGLGQCQPVDGGVACAPIEDAGACTTTTGATVTCDDAGIARSCVSGKEVRVDCTSLALPCSKPETPLDPTQACANKSAGTACINPDECAGQILKSCGRGKLFEVDCKKQGLGNCVKSPGGVATCALP